MAALWTKTKLSTKPAVHYMSDTDRHALTFSLGEAITDVTVQLLQLPERTSVAASIEDAVVDDDGTGAVVIVTDLTHDEQYALEVTMIRADLTTETAVLAIECVA